MSDWGKALRFVVLDTPVFTVVMEHLSSDSNVDGEIREARQMILWAVSNQVTLRIKNPLWDHIEDLVFDDRMSMYE